MRRLLLAVLSLAIAAGAVAQPPAETAKKPAAKPAATKPRAVKPGVRPAWAELTAEQQQVLAPLKADWDTLDPDRRLKWIAIAKRYPRMKPLGQDPAPRPIPTWPTPSPAPP